MIVETGTVVALESDALWVETIQKQPAKPVLRKKVAALVFFLS